MVDGQVQDQFPIEKKHSHAFRGKEGDSAYCLDK